MTRVYVEDMKAVSTRGLCNKGGRKFFAKHGLDWPDFLRSGIDAEILIALDDHIAMQVVRAAEKRELGVVSGE